jgi:hypothetical protein
MCFLCGMNWGVISQKTALFIVTAVETSSPIEQIMLFWCHSGHCKMKNSDKYNSCLNWMSDAQSLSCQRHQISLGLWKKVAHLSNRTTVVGSLLWPPGLEVSPEHESHNWSVSLDLSFNPICDGALCRGYPHNCLAGPCRPWDVRRSSRDPHGLYPTWGNSVYVNR